MEACAAQAPLACSSSPTVSSRKSASAKQEREAKQKEPNPKETNEKDSAAPCKVIVTGYPPYSRAEDIVLVLTKFGTVTIDKKGRREAILTFSNEEEAKAAIRGTKTMMIYGEYLTIKPYTPTSPQKNKKANNKREFPKTKEKSSIIEPKDIDLSGDFYEQLDRVMAAIRLTQEDVNALSTIYVDLENILQTLWPGCQAVPFGSITTGLGIKTSDADCFILVPSRYNHPYANFVNRAKKLLQMYPRLFTEIISIPRANTPIVKFFHIPTKTNCDVSFKTPLGVQNSRLIAFLLHSDPRLIPLSVVIKYWAKVHDFSGTGKLTNYALTMMIIFYLQQLPMSILPTVEWLQRDSTYDCLVGVWNTGFMGQRELLPPASNTSSISELLGGFFEFYASFNFDEMIVCPYLGKPISKEAFNDFNVLPDNFERYKDNVMNGFVLPIRNDTAICVQDPVEQSHNVASAVSGQLASDIRAYFKFAANIYDKEKLTNCEKFISTILLQKVELPRNKAHPEYRVMLFQKTLVKIEDEDWKSVVKEILFVVFEKMLKIKLSKIEEVVNPDTKKEKEKYTGEVTKPLWKRKQFSRLYESMGLNIAIKHENITQEILKFDKEEFEVKFQITLKFCHKPRSVVMAMRLITGNIENYRKFGRFITSVTHNWFEDLLRAQSKNIGNKIKENTKLLSEISLSETNKIQLVRQIIDREDYESDDSS